MNNISQKWWVAASISLILLCNACERKSGRIGAPAVVGNPAEGFIQEFDKDGDGKITAQELPLGIDFESFDVDRDKSISLAELSDIVDTWQSMKVGLTAFHMQFKLNGRTLEGATVTLEPYAFLGSEISSAEGVSDINGLVQFSVPEGSVPSPNLKVMHCGFYRMKVSKQVNGKETIPEKYNTKTVLGAAVLPNIRGKDSVEL